VTADQAVVQLLQRTPELGLLYYVIKNNCFVIIVQQ